MPQPLNRVRSDIEFHEDAHVLLNKPVLAGIVTTIFAHSSLIDQRLSLLLVRVLGADAAPALAMFDTLIAQHLQIGALEAAAQEALTPEELRVFQTTLKVEQSVQSHRHRLGHWIWGRALQLPDALLLAEPKAQTERDRELALALEQSDTGSLNIEQAVKLNRYDPRTVLVYTQTELEQIGRDFLTAAHIALLTVIYLDGIFRGRRKLPPTQAASSPKLREQVFQQLYTQRLFREVWDRTIQAPNNNPQSPLGSPQQGPSG